MPRADSASAGWTIVSGCAYGIDAAAHRGALAGEGRTIAVFAGGLDQCYPPRNQALFEELSANQLVVSEAAPLMRATKVGFLARNRLIAALSTGTIVVEAAARSGARNTASWAGELNRLVMAVPGPVHSAVSVTPHRMIRDGEATLVSCVDDVLAMVNRIGDGPELPITGPQRWLDALPIDLRTVRESLPARRGATTDEIIVKSGLAAGNCLVALADLEARGLAATDGRSTWWLVTPKTQTGG